MVSVLSDGETRDSWGEATDSAALRTNVLGFATRHDSDDTRKPRRREAAAAGSGESRALKRPAVSCPQPRAAGGRTVTQAGPCVATTLSVAT